MNAGAAHAAAAMIFGLKSVRPRQLPAQPCAIRVRTEDCWKIIDVPGLAAEHPA